MDRKEKKTSQRTRRTRISPISNFKGWSTANVEVQSVYFGRRVKSKRTITERRNVAEFMQKQIYKLMGYKTIFIPPNTEEISGMEFSERRKMIKKISLRNDITLSNKLAATTQVKMQKEMNSDALRDREPGPAAT